MEVVCQWNGDMNSGNVPPGAHHTTSVIQSVAPAILRPFCVHSASNLFPFSLLLFYPSYSLLS